MPPCTWIDRSQAATAASAQSDLADAAAIAARSSSSAMHQAAKSASDRAELELHQRRCERMRDRLVGADRLAELVPLAGVGDGELERARADAAGLERRAR